MEQGQCITILEKPFVRTLLAAATSEAASTIFFIRRGRSLVHLTSSTTQI